MSMKHTCRVPSNWCARYVGLTDRHTHTHTRTRGHTNKHRIRIDMEMDGDTHAFATHTHVISALTFARRRGLLRHNKSEGTGHNTQPPPPSGPLGSCGMYHLRPVPDLPSLSLPWTVLVNTLVCHQTTLGHDYDRSDVSRDSIA